jgi:hypothetical protein
MKPRVRTKETWASAGRAFEGQWPQDYRVWVPVAGPFAYKTTEWECHDFVDKKKREDGSTPPSDLWLRKTTFKPAFYSIDRVSILDGKLGQKLSQAPCFVPGTSYDLPPGGWSSIEGTDEELVAKLLANTNPFRYEVSVPVMIAELVEAASLLKLASNNFLSLLGSQHLNWEFGWKPTIEDIRTLSTITIAIEKRIREFNSLLKKGGLRRKVYLASGSKSAEQGWTALYSNGWTSAWSKPSTSWKSQVWGSVRWKPNRDSPIDITTLASFNEACKIVLDLRVPDASTIWEAIPFSWLVDYFLNVGDALQAVEDTDKVVPYDICIMRQRTIVTSAGVLGGVEVDWRNRWTTRNSSGKVEHSFKMRNVYQPGDVGDLLSFGIMSKRQATNLLALLLSLARFR